MLIVNNDYCLTIKYNNRNIIFKLDKQEYYNDSDITYDVNVYINKENYNYYYDNQGVCTELKDVIDCSMDCDGGSFSFRKESSGIYLVNANFVSGSHWLDSTQEFVHDDVVLNVKRKIIYADPQACSQIKN